MYVLDRKCYPEELPRKEEDGDVFVEEEGDPGVPGVIGVVGVVGVNGGVEEVDSADEVRR